MLPPVITIDGPSGSGKSTLSKKLSNYLKWHNLESGLMYRILSCLFLKNNFPMTKKFLIPLFNDLDKYFIYQNKIISNVIKKDFSHKYIISKEVTDTASKLATLSYVRDYLLLKQRLFRQKPGLIANGRDMGTIIFPDATIKFFLKADLKKRVDRRMIDLKNQGLDINYQDLMNQIKKRDDRDKNRKYSPLKSAKDAIILDSSNISKNELLKIVIQYIKNHDFFKSYSFYN